MNKTFRTYLIIFAVALGIIAVLELNKSEVINWSKDFDINGKNPFGLFIFSQEADSIFNGKLEKTIISPYDYYEKDSLQPAHNVLIIEKLLTHEGAKKILKRVEQGDYVFCFNQDISFLADSLGLHIYQARWTRDNMLMLKDQKFLSDSIYIDKLAGGKGISRLDTLTTRILGSSWNDGEKEIANFVEVKHGKGKFYFHTEPMVLTNFYLLKNDDYQYVENIFSYLPDRRTVWFQDSQEYVNTSPLRFILSQPALRYAWYLFLLSLPLFVFFHAKRRQRVVPVIEPLKNSSAEFVKTIGNLYLQEGNSKDMAQKKATYFLNKVRTELLIDTGKLDDAFIKKLQLKTGASEKIIKEAMPLIEKAMHPQAPVQQEELLKLNDLLDQIYS